MRNSEGRKWGLRTIRGLPYNASMRAVLLVLSIVLVAACDSENVSWIFISNPGGTISGAPPGGTIIVVKGGGGRSSSLTYAGGSVVVSGEDEAGPVRVHLPAGAEVAVLEHRGGLSVLSPALPGGRIDLSGGRLEPAVHPAVALRVLLLDASQAAPTLSGPGVLYIAADGTLLVAEAGGAVVAHRPDVEPATFAGRLAVRGDQLTVVGPGGRSVTLEPAEPSAAEGAERNLPTEYIVTGRNCYVVHLIGGRRG